MENVRNSLFRLRLGETVEIDFPLTELVDSGLKVLSVTLSMDVITGEKKAVGFIIDEDVTVIWRKRKFIKGSMVYSA